MGLNKLPYIFSLTFLQTVFQRTIQLLTQHLFFQRVQLKEGFTYQ